ncbi:MAG: peptide synthase [Planctomycetota bacterium]|nr:MAG: peptide synthase [Planctomycetota bacterium]
MSSPLNIADRLRQSARLWPDQRAVVCPTGRDRPGRVIYAQRTFRELDAESDALAMGLRALGVKPGSRLVLMVRPSIEFIALTFGMFKAGAVIVLIDPGMGRTNIFKCLEEVDPEGFVAIPVVQWIRMISRKFPNARFNVRVGKGWAPGCVATYQSLLKAGIAKLPQSSERDLTTTESSGSAGASSSQENVVEHTKPTDPAAVIFTSGSTGPPKGVLYEHGMFNAQVDLLQQFYNIRPGEVDLPGFPLFGLFNAAMGVTTVIPDMDPTKPAKVDPLKIIESINDNGVTQAFGSPAFWNRVGTHCVQHGVTLPALNRALSAGGPVPLRVVEMMSRILTRPGAFLHTPYGATESLPVASTSSHDVLTRSAAKTREGAGTCVGRAFPGVNIRIIPITEEPISSISDTQTLPPGEIGEIIVRSPAVTREYFRRPEPTAAAKIPDGESFWHRIGDVGYLDEDQQLWFCGRKAHVVYPVSGPMYSVCCEGIFDSHPDVFRAALVGVGPLGSQRPVLIVELLPSKVQSPQLVEELRTMAQARPLTQPIETFLFHPGMPVDTRHNVKIQREALSVWAAEELQRQGLV